MTKETVAYLLSQVQQVNLPQRHQHTPQIQVMYEEGLDIVESWRGNPYIIQQAILKFCETNSSAYARAGIAFALSTAGYISDGKFDSYGSKVGLEWLEEAQSIEPNRAEINVIEAILYFRLERFDDARTVMDELARRKAINYWTCRLEMSFAEKHGDLKALQRWYNQSKQNTANESQNNNALKALADAFLRNKAHDQALKAYQTLGKRTPKDPWTWHNISIIYLRMGNYAQAEIHNTRALQLMDFEAARDIRHTLRGLKRSRMGWFWGFISRIFGRAPNE